jgi:hypothetical protein
VIQFPDQVSIYLGDNGDQDGPPNS